MAINYRGRIALLKREILARRLDSLLITNKVNVSYLSGFASDDSLLLITPGKDFFITDSRYIEEAEESVEGYDVRLVKRSTYDTLTAIARTFRLKRTGFESMDLPYAVAARLKKLMDGTRLVPIKGLVEDLRAVKDDSEVELIKNAIRLTKNTFDKIGKLIKPGVREEFIAKSFELEFIRNGAKSAFMPITAAGANSSKPHAAPTGARIGNNSFVMLDAGCSLNGYCSDITRMVTVGKLQKKFARIYNIVRAAQAMAIGAIKPGVNIAEVDLCARRYIQKNGFGKYFTHAAGHGVGMEVHELPNISRMNKDALKPGMVFTIEPAIYIPRFGGVRIEDMVLVTDKGREVLT